MTVTKVRYAELAPHEFRQRLADKPLAYLPLGTLEWHGEHLPFGSDAIQSEGLMVACAQQLGGIVLPPIHLGPDGARRLENGQMLYGMDGSKWTTPPRQLDGSCYWVSRGLFKLLVDAILEQLKRAGFKAVFADGHGPSRWSWVEDIPEREARFGLTLLGVTADIRDTWPSMIDHAARNETSIMLALRPELVDLNQLAQDPTVWPQGVAGEDPRGATAEYGAQALAAAVEIVRRKLTEAGV
jgi:creatinine amidohydrolase